MNLCIKKIRTILELCESGQSVRQIARTLNISKSVVSKTLQKARAISLASSTVKETDDSTLMGLFYPQTLEELSQQIDWYSVDAQMSHKHSNLKLVYENQLAANPEIEISYSHFAYLYRKWSKEHKLIGVVHNNLCKPGEKIEVDFSGDALQWITPDGKIIKCRLFTACLPYSGYIFAFATLDETARSWAMGITAALLRIGGVPKVLIVDNAKALVRQASKSEGIINYLLNDMSEYYGMDSWSCAPHSPKEKNRVEASVSMVQTWVQGQLELNSEGPIFAENLDQLNQKILIQAEKVNKRPFSNNKDKISRYDKFVAEELRTLSPLPALPYEICDWKVLTADKSHCIKISSDHDHRYSVPVEFTRKQVIVRLSKEEVQIFSPLDNALIGRHVRCYELYGQKTHILEEHLTREERNRRREAAYFIDVFVNDGIESTIAQRYVQGVWDRFGEFLARQRLHAIVRNLLGAYPPALLNEAMADAADLNQFKYRQLQELLKLKQEMLRRQLPLCFGSEDPDYKTPTHSNIRNNYE